MNWTAAGDGAEQSDDRRDQDHEHETVERAGEREDARDESPEDGRSNRSYHP